MHRIPKGFHCCVICYTTFSSEKSRLLLGLICCSGCTTKSAAFSNGNIHHIAGSCKSTRTVVPRCNELIYFLWQLQGFYASLQELMSRTHWPTIATMQYRFSSRVKFYQVFNCPDDCSIMVMASIICILQGMFYGSLSFALHSHYVVLRA